MSSGWVCKVPCQLVPPRATNGLVTASLCLRLLPGLPFGIASLGVTGLGFGVGGCERDTLKSLSLAQLCGD